MKVGSIPSAAQLNPYADVKRITQSPGAVSQKTDKLELTGSKQQFQVAMKAARDVPEVRMEKVEAIKTQIEAGTYKVDSRAVAEKILEQHRR